MALWETQYDEEPTAPPESPSLLRRIANSQFVQGPLGLLSLPAKGIGTALTAAQGYLSTGDPFARIRLAAEELPTADPSEEGSLYRTLTGQAYTAPGGAELAQEGIALGAHAAGLPEVGRALGFEQDPMAVGGVRDLTPEEWERFKAEHPTAARAGAVGRAAVGLGGGLATDPTFGAMRAASARGAARASEAPALEAALRTTPLTGAGAAQRVAASERLAELAAQRDALARIERASAAAFAPAAVAGTAAGAENLYRAASEQGLTSPEALGALFETGIYGSTLPATKRALRPLPGPPSPELLRGLAEGEARREAPLRLDAPLREAPPAAEAAQERAIPRQPSPSAEDLADRAFTAGRELEEAELGGLSPEVRSDYAGRLASRRGGVAYVETLKARFGDEGPDGVTVYDTDDPGRKVVVQRAGGRVVAGGEGIGDTRLMVAGGPRIGSPVSARPVFEALEQLGYGPSDVTSSYGLEAQQRRGGRAPGGRLPEGAGEAGVGVPRPGPQEGVPGPAEPTAGAPLPRAAAPAAEDVSFRPTDASPQEVAPPPPAAEPPPRLGQATLDRLTTREGEVRARIQARGARLSSTTQAGGFAEGPGALADLVELGAIKVAKGAIEFGQWAEEMVRDAGEAVRPQLERVWGEARRRSVALIHGEEGAADITSPSPMRAELEEFWAKFEPTFDPDTPPSARVERFTAAVNNSLPNPTQRDLDAARALASGRVGVGYAAPAEPTPDTPAYTDWYRSKFPGKPLSMGKLNQFEREMANLPPPKGGVLERLNQTEAEIKARNAERLKKISSSTQSTALMETPGVLRDMVELGAVKIAKGAVRFGEWAEEMVKEFGEQIRPRLEKLWEEARSRARTLATMGEEGAPQARPDAKPPVAPFNYTRMDLPTPMREALDRFSQVAVGKQRRVGQEEFAAEAAALGLSRETIQDVLKSRTPTEHELLVARQYSADYGRRLTDAAEKVRSAATPAAKDEAAIELAKLGAEADTFLNLFKERQTRHARGLAMFNILAEGPAGALPPEAQALYGRLVKQGLRGEDIGKVLAAKTGGERLELMQRIANPTLTDKLYELWINGILSRPMTNIANTMGNTAMWVMRGIERGTSGLIEGMRAPTGERERHVRDALSHFGAAKEIGTAWRQFMKSWKGEIGSEAGLNEHLPAISGRTGQVVRWPTRLLEATDQFFRHLSASSEKHVQAWRQAHQQGGSASDVADRYSKLLGEWADGTAIPTKVKAEMTRSADVDTFRQRLGPVMSRVMGMRNIVPGARWVLPFVRTPWNITVEGAKRTPLHFLDIIAKTRSGALKGGGLSDELAKAMVGTTLTAALAATVGEGGISGGGPTDGKLRQNKLRTGWQPYSVKVGDTWYSYQRIEPFATFLGFLADAVETAKAGDEKGASGFFDKAGQTFLTNFANKTFLQGLTNFTGAVSDPGANMERFVRGYLRSAVPFSGALATVAEATDPVQRQVRPISLKNPSTLLEPLAERIPGARQTLEPRRAATGEELPFEQSALERTFSPFRSSQEKPERVLEREFDRLGYVPDSPARKLKVQGKEVELTSQEFEQFTRAREKGARAAERLIRSPAYQALEDYEKEEKLRVVLLRPAKQLRQRLRRRLEGRARGVVV